MCGGYFVGSNKEQEFLRRPVQIRACGARTSGVHIRTPSIAKRSKVDVNVRIKVPSSCVLAGRLLEARRAIA